MRKLRLLLVAVWVVFVTTVSLFSWRPKLAHGTPMRELARQLGYRPQFFLSQHRVHHIFGFGMTAFLVMTCTRNRAQALALAAATVVFSFAIEVAQRSIYTVDLEWWDIRDDIYGVICALLILEIGRYLRRAA